MVAAGFADCDAVGMARLWGTTVALGLFSAGMWLAWLGWDHEYYLVDGVPQGPYEAWQVVGCGLAIAVAAMIAYLWVRRAVAILSLTAAATIGFAVPWSVDASASDDTGLWGVGLIFLLVGGGAGIAILLAVTAAIAKPRHSSTA